MQTIRKSQLVPFTAKQMYQLVDNINDYQLYLPWCSKSEEHKRSENEVTATLSIKAQGIEKSFTTRNTLTPYSQIELNLVDGPFSHLKGYWRFCDTDEGCKVDFELNFEISNKILALFIGPLFEKTTGTMLESFCKQASKSYSTNDC